MGPITLPDIGDIAMKKDLCHELTWASLNKINKTYNRHREELRRKTRELGKEMNVCVCWHFN